MRALPLGWANGEGYGAYRWEIAGPDGDRNALLRCPLLQMRHAGPRTSEPPQQCSPCLPHLEPDEKQRPPPKTRPRAPPELTQADAEGETHRGAGTVPGTHLTLPALAAGGHAGSCSKASRGLRMDPVGAATVVSLQRLAPRRSNQRIFHGHEPYPKRQKGHKSFRNSRS